MQEFDFLRPMTLSELTRLLGETNGNIIAGGTDIIPKMKRSQYPTSMVIDISQIEELRFIRRKKGRIKIGALTTHQDIAGSALLFDYNPALVSAAKTVGCEQTRNRGTLGGNIANASPAADTIPPLLIFDTNIHLHGKTGGRTISLRDFLVGPGITKLMEGEFIRSVSFKPFKGGWGAAFQKLGKRNGMAISVVSAAAAIKFGADGKIAQARLSLGSVAPKVVRSSRAESVLTGQYLTSKILEEASHVCLEDIAPISDIRASAEYRRKSAKVIAYRVLSQAANDASRRMG